MLDSSSPLRIVAAIVLIVLGIAVAVAFLQLLFAAVIIGIGAYLLLRRPAPRRDA
jgi:Na+-transporting methylmalonyl-CoA/oxaloacetate decarboxylase gamma subunit